MPAPCLQYWMLALLAQAHGVRPASPPHGSSGSHQKSGEFITGSIYSKGNEFNHLTGEITMSVKKVKTVVLAYHGSGVQEFVHLTVDVTEEMYDNGEHYDHAKKYAASQGFEEPMIAFDENDTAASDIKKLAEWLAK